MSFALTTHPVRVIVADDSQLAIARLTQIFSEHSGIVVAATATGGEELHELVEQLRPDVVTLDLLMPDRAGLSLIRGLATMTQVVVVSDLPEGSPLAEEAIAQGARAFVSKRELGHPQGTAQLVRSVLQHAHPARPTQIVAIAGSTGAMPALERIIPDLAGAPAAFVIVQHLPAPRVDAFSEWITSLGLGAETVGGAQSLRTGFALVAPGDRHLKVVAGTHVVLDDGEALAGHKPSVTVLVKSLVRCAPRTTLVVLSGMGRDGAAAVPDFVAAGGTLITQRSETCVVPGMPDAAHAAGPHGHRLSPAEIGPFVLARMHARRHG